MRAVHGLGNPLESAEPVTSRLSPPRLTALPLPPYAYVPGQHPHPIHHPAGHRYGMPTPVYGPLDPQHWATSEPYRYGIDLFNYGYYWEAHEVWESLWRAHARTEPIARFLQALIALAAAGVKQRQGRVRGVQRHGERAKALLCQAAQPLDQPRTYLGLDWNRLLELATQLAQSTDCAMAFPRRLTLEVCLPEPAAPSRGATPADPIGT
ncbi:MAG TPA: DUF309 domain-containing protein [Candidatus Competibacteraceae bacterium]|nr:DUF309 domain-containing protein [Candidatus Competibacteraceae bacterium]